MKTYSMIISLFFKKVIFYCDVAEIGLEDYLNFERAEKSFS